MIEFIELEPFETLGGSPGEKQTLIPVFMEKGGERYFVTNRSISPTDDGRLADIKAALLQNGCRFFKFYGVYDAPDLMIANMIEHRHTFVRPDDLFHVTPSSEQDAEYTDFRGNLNEVSAAFSYRIYDKAYAYSLKEIAAVVIGMKSRSRKIDVGKPAVMLSSDGTTKGKIINFNVRPCGMESCRSYRTSVRWEDGSLTYPCMSEVMEVEEGVYKIME